MGGMLVGIIACLILIACGSDNSNANAPQPTATNRTAGELASSPAGSGVAQPASGGAVAPAAQGNLNVPLQPSGNLNQDVRNVIKATRPAVVLITAETVRGGDDFAGVFGRNQPVQRGVGTGSIIDASGFILTNFHVIEGANRVTVTLPDGRRYPGRIVGSEGQVSDMAIIKIDPKAGETLPVIKRGDSSKLEIGEAVVAIGNALGLPGGPTVTAGIISAFGRNIQEPNGAQLTDMLQTDAAINPGNSGGPLLNLRGELIGMNTAAPVDQSSGGAAQGIGLALNINQTNRYIDAFVKGQTVERPFMGVLPQDMSAGIAERFQLPIDYGALISRVDPNTPAAQAGWKAGEIIVKMDGTDIRNTTDLSNVLARHKAGDRVNATIVGRDGKSRETQITFGRPPR